MEARQRHTIQPGEKEASKVLRSQASFSSPLLAPASERGTKHSLGER